MKLTNQHISRQLDIVPINILEEQINIIGAGAVGSWTALALAKMGFKNITVFDFDKVDIVNMSSQMFRFQDIDQYKTTALQTLVQDFTETKIEAVADRWSGAKLNGITIMAADSMEVRKQIFEAHKGHLQSRCLIDARMGAETMLIYTVNPNTQKDQEFYMNTWYTDAEATQAPCTAKSTTYCALVISGLVAKTVRDVLVGSPYLRNMTFDLKKNDFLAFSKELI